MRRTLSAGALAAVALGVGLSTPSRAAAHATVCQDQPGHTLVRREEVRVFRVKGDVFGCVPGHTRRVALWVKLPEQRSELDRVAGPYVAVGSTTSNQYTYDRSLYVYDLLNGASYAVAGLSSPMPALGQTTGSPATPGPWPIEAFALSRDGRTARLYATYAAGANASAQPDGQLLDVIGPHHFHHTLATTAAGAIAPASLTYHHGTVTWTQGGMDESVKP